MDFDQISLSANVPSETPSFQGAKGAEHFWKFLISGATKSISISQMYFASDGTSSMAPIIDEIKRAAARGVDVFIEIDAHVFRRNVEAHSDWYTIPILDLQKHKNIEVHFNENRRKSGGILHAKCVVADKERFWLGSNNMDWRALEHIYELGVFMESAELSRVLDVAIRQPAGGSRIVSGSAGKPPSSIWFDNHSHQVELTISPSSDAGSGLRDCVEALVELVDEAEESISLSARKIGNHSRDMNLGDWDVFVDRLAKAVQRGVAVRLLVDEYQLSKPADLDFIMEWPKRAGVTTRLVRVPAHSSGDIPHARMHHAKCIVLDQRTTWIGSNNMMPDDFLRARNFGLTIESVRLAEEANQFFNMIWESPYAIELPIN